MAGNHGALRPLGRWPLPRRLSRGDPFRRCLESFLNYDGVLHHDVLGRSDQSGRYL